MANRAVALPLIALVFTWWFFMMASLVNLNIPMDQWDTSGNQIFHYEGIRWATYLQLAGIAVTTLAALIGQGWAIKSMASEVATDTMPRAALRFTNFAVVVGLAASTIFAIGNFMGGFNNFSSRDESLPIRIVNLYVPIILATALVVVVLLRAFVFRHSPADEATDTKPRMSDAQKALALGYATPILTTTIAIIFGLVVYDVTKTNLQTWVWVIIIAIVGLGIIWGTMFANRARAVRPAPPKTRTALAAGAATLNFVLSIVFGAVVSIMSFSMGDQAFQKLMEYPTDGGIGKYPVNPILHAPTWKWLIEEMAPAKILLLLAVIGVYLAITLRNKKSTEAK